MAPQGDLPSPWLSRAGWCTLSCSQHWRNWPCCHVAVELFCQGLPLIPTVSGWSCWAELPVSCGAGNRGQLRALSAVLQGGIQSRMRLGEQHMQGGNSSSATTSSAHCNASRARGGPVVGVGCSFFPAFVLMVLCHVA